MADNGSAAACSLLHRIFSDDNGDTELNASELLAPASAAVANTSVPASPASPALDQLKIAITSVIIPAFWRRCLKYRAAFKGGGHASHQQRASHQTVHILFLANDRCPRDYDLVVVHC